MSTRPRHRPTPPAPGWVDEPMRWAQLTLVEDDPGRFDLAVLARLLPPHPQRRGLPQRRRLRRLLPHRGPASTTAAAGSATATRSASWSTAAGSSAWSCSRGPTRTRPTTTSARPTPTGSPSTPGTAAPALGLARDVGHLRPGAVQLRVHDRGPPGDHDALQGRRHLHQPLGRLRDVLLRALPDELPGRDRARAAPDGRPAGPCAGGRTSSGSQERLFELWRLWDGEVREDQPRLARHPERRGRRDQPARHEGHRRARPDAVRRPPGAERAHAPVGQRQGRARSTAPRWATSPSGASSAWASRRRTAGRTRCRARRRSASGSPTGSPTACGPGSPSSPACSATAAGSASSRTSTAGTTAPSGTSGTRSRSPGWAGLLAADRLVLRRPEAGARRSRTTRWAGTRRSSRPGSPSRWSTTGSSTRPTWRRSSAHPAEHRRPVGRAVPAAPRVRRARRQARGDLRDVALRRAGQPAGGLRPGRPVRRPRRGRRRGPMRNAYLRLEADPATGRRHPLLAGLDDAPRVIHGTWRLDVTPADRVRGDRPLTLIPSYPDLPMEMVYPRPDDRRRRGCTSARSAAGRVVYFPWDIDRVFWEVLAVDHGLLLATPCGGRRREEPPVEVEGPRRARRDRLAAGRLDDRAPGQPDEPDDDEGPVPRADPGRRAAGADRPAGGAEARGSSSSWPAARSRRTQDGTPLSVDVPSVRDHEVVAIDLA